MITATTVIALIGGAADLIEKIVPIVKEAKDVFSEDDKQQIDTALANLRQRVDQRHDEVRSRLSGDD